MASKRPSDNEEDERSSKFQKLTGREHILQRSSMYVGSTIPEEADHYIINDEGKCEKLSINVAPGLLNIIEEALMNAADRVSAAHEATNNIVCKTTKISIDVIGTKICVVNNGTGIPIQFLEEHGVYVPELVFGHLHTSSNYNDDLERLNSGLNGLGIKLTNTLSKELVVETVDAESGQKYRQVFSDNMSVIGKPKISKFSGSPYTKVTFDIDIERFGLSSMSQGIVNILHRRAHEISFCSLDPVKVSFNGKLVKVNTIDKYMRLFVGDAPIYSSVNERWKVAVSFTPDDGKVLSFVNSTFTSAGGTHVTHVVDPLVKKLLVLLRKKFKTPKMKPALVKDSLTIVISAHIVNPTFSTQTKDYLTLLAKDFGSSFEVSDSIVNKIMKSGLVDHISEILKNSDGKKMSENDGKKTSRIKGIPKLHDAGFAGTKKSKETFLIVTEGDSALSMALSGASVIGRERFGAFPLRGKLLNVRDASSQQISSNAEITNLKKILGLQNGVEYEDTSKLRYGGIILLTDSDVDGTHIRGLLMNLFAVFWPSLLKLGYVKTLNTPIVRAVRGSDTKYFYKEHEYEEWKNASDISGYKIKYLKGLGSSTPAEAREYFKDIYNSLVEYVTDLEYSESMSLAFNKKRAGDRKKWLMDFDSSRIVLSNSREVSISDFVNKDLIHFSHSDVLRSIPSVVDGLKLSHRKALCGSFMRGILNTEAKVAQLTGFVSDKMQYHHGETSMSGTIVGMAQDFVGSNNINYLLPKGQLGSRLSGGKDAASPRYTFVQMNPVSTLLFKKEDSPVLEYTEDEGCITEPVFYAPIISTALVNGCTSIATGWSTSIPSFDPRDLSRNIRLVLEGKQPNILKPFYRGFKGTIELAEKGSYVVKGVYEVDDSNVHITELPVGTWTMNYKHFLEGLVEKKLVQGYTESCTDDVVDFTVMLKEPCSDSELVSLLHLSSTIRTSNMHMFDSVGKIRKYEDVAEIEKEHFEVRKSVYSKRREYMLNVLRHESNLLSEKVRFFELKIEGKIVLENLGLEEVLKNLGDLGFVELGSKFDSKERSMDYLTSLKLFDITREKVSALTKQRDLKVKELKSLEETSVSSLWLNDLDELDEWLSRNYEG